MSDFGHDEPRGLTRRQQAVLTAIRDLTNARNGRPPSVREIGAASGLSSTSSVAHQIRKLRTLGYLVETMRGETRGIALSGYEAPAPAWLADALDDLPERDAHLVIDGLEGRIDGVADFGASVRACAEAVIRLVEERDDHKAPAGVTA